MAWKRKEKELSPEEAIAAAKAHAAPFWSGLPPQFTVLDVNGTTRLFPLEPKFSEQAWFLAFLDLTDIAGQTMTAFLKEWKRRYSVFGIQSLIVIEAPGAYAEDKKLVGDLFQELEISNPYVIDQQKRIAHGFGMPSASGFLFYQGGKVHFQTTTVDEFSKFEASIQDTLRMKDPGLPLFPLYVPHTKYQRTVVSVQFANGANFKPFIAEDSQTASEIRRHMGQELFALTGKWERDAEKIHTSDPKARLIFVSPTPEVHLLAASLTKLIEHGKVMIEVDETPPYQAFMGDDLQTDEAGQSYVPARKFGLYKALQNLPEGARLVEFRFPSANRIPIALFGIRFVEVR